MLKEILGFYLQGLGLSLVLVLGSAAFWLLHRVEAEMDKTPQERRRIRNEIMLMCLLTIPLLAFALMAILLMLKA